MTRTRNPYRPWLLAPMIMASAVGQGGAFAVYHFTRPPPVPVVTVRIGGAGEGVVVASVQGGGEPLIRCVQGRCIGEVPMGSELVLRATPGEKATFEGWNQWPERPFPVLRPFVGDPLAACLDRQIPGAGPAALPVGDVLTCHVRVERGFAVEARFGRQPDEVMVALATPPNIEALIRPPQKKPDVIEPEPLEELEVALKAPDLPPPLPLPLTPPPPPPPPPPPAAAQPLPLPDNMRMVEVPNQNEVEKAPDDATHLSDKNRDVAEETRATETNLEREQEGKAVASRPSDDKSSAEVGGPDDRIRQLEEVAATTEARAEESDHSGHDHSAHGIIVGEGGQRGEEGKGERANPGLLAMRDIGGRGSIIDRGGDGKKAGQKGLPGVKSQLSFADYERIMGKEKVDKERDLAARKMASKKGRWEQKMAAIKSSLENFTPNVRPGNQTALKTRAHPFALYVARMHRRIHELWGFGFLEALDDKGSDHPLNDFELATTIELAVNPDGSVHKPMIARTSGKTEFDVAALDTVLTAAPYDETPEQIRSVDQRVYLRWTFNRNWRQCGTFNVEPYILTEIPGGIEPLEQGQVVAKEAPRTARPVTPEPKEGGPGGAPVSSVKDPRALYAANLWVSGFTAGELEKMVRFSSVPFRAGGKVAAQNKGELTAMYTQLVAESGRMRDWQLLTPEEYAARNRGGPELPVDSVLLMVRTERERFALVFSKTAGGEYRATQLAR